MRRGTLTRWLLCDLFGRHRVSVCWRHNPTHAFCTRCGRHF